MKMLCVSSRNASKLCFRFKVQDALTALGLDHDNVETIVLQYDESCDRINKFLICVSSAAAADLSEELCNDDPVI